jgi:hypothetical protein
MEITNLICDLVSATKPNVGFLPNLVQKFYAKSCKTSMSFLKIGAVTVIFDLRA